MMRSFLILGGLDAYLNCIYMLNRSSKTHARWWRCISISIDFWEIAWHNKFCLTEISLEKTFLTLLATHTKA